MLGTFFEPNGVAIIGASRDESKLGFGVVRNMLESGYPGALHFVNPKADQLFGRPCYPDIASVPDPVELAIVIVPAERVPETLDACGRRGLKGAIIVSGGFGETDERGRALEREALEVARRHGLRLMGPNCIGSIDAHFPINTTFIKSVPQPGDIAFVSQSGAICQAVIDWGTGMGFGFSRVASLGNQVDVSECEMLQSLIDDPHTGVVTMYLEGVKDGREFLVQATELARKKAVVALKVGRTAAGKRAVSSHTGALAGEEAAYDAAFDRCGVMRAANTEELFDWARALAWCPEMKGDRVTVLTNAGGPGILAADALETSGLKPAELAPETLAKLREFARPHASLHNPVDMLASGGPAEYGKFLGVILEDPNTDAVLVISVPPPIGDPAPVAEAIAAAAEGATKPVVVAVMGEETVGEALRVLRRARIPDYRFPERAASALAALCRQREWRARGRFIPFAFPDVKPGAARDLIDMAESDQLGGAGASAVLATYGIFGPCEMLVRNADEAVAWSEKFGYPVVLKVASPDIPHKSDIGGVALDLGDHESVRLAYRRVTEAGRAAHPDAHIDGATVQQMVRGGQEVIIGAVRDEQFGPLMMFGAGGIEVEGARDVSFALAPLSRKDAEAMVDATFAGRRLRGFRNIPPADREAAIRALLRLAQFAADFPEVREVEVNPLRVQKVGEGAVAVDVRMRLSRAHPAS